MPDSRQGTVLRIERASSDTPLIKSAVKGLPEDSPVTAVFFDAEARLIYATAAQKVFMSAEGEGDYWSLLYEGLETEDTRGVYVRETAVSEPGTSAATGVVVASTAGTQAIIGYPVLNFWGGSLEVRRKDAINLKFSAPISEATDNLRRVTVEWKKKQIAVELAKKDARTNLYSLMPKKGSWPKAKREKLKVKVGDGLLDITNRQLDSDNDGLEDGLGFSFDAGILSTKKGSPTR